MRTRKRLSTDEAIIALLIGAMEANRHAAAREAARAHNLIWSMRRFRGRKGEAVGRLIASVREAMNREGIATVLDRAAASIPPRLRATAFAASVDLMLADTTLEREERRLLERLSRGLKVPPKQADEIVRVLLIKNSV